MPRRGVSVRRASPDDDGTLAEFARSIDLVVTGAHNGAANEAHLSANPELFALKRGWPVLVAPNGYEANGLATHPLVAWDGKCPSARARGTRWTFWPTRWS